MIVRPGAPADAALLPDVENSAGALFATIPELAWVATHGATSAEQHLEFIANGVSFVAEHEGALVGFLVGSFHSGDLYIDELAVHADHQRRGIGRALIAAAETYARANGYSVITLTTFQDVPWNGPYYASLGFAAFTPAPGSYLGQILIREGERGLPNRCAMRRPVALTANR